MLSSSSASSSTRAPGTCPLTAHVVSTTGPWSTVPCLGLIHSTSCSPPSSSPSPFPSPSFLLRLWPLVRLRADRRCLFSKRRSLATSPGLTLPEAGAAAARPPTPPPPPPPTLPSSPPTSASNSALGREAAALAVAVATAGATARPPPLPGCCQGSDKGPGSTAGWPSVPATGTATMGAASPADAGARAAAGAALPPPCTTMRGGVTGGGRAFRVTVGPPSFPPGAWGVSSVGASPACTAWGLAPTSGAVVEATRGRVEVEVPGTDAVTAAVIGPEAGNGAAAGVTPGGALVADTRRSRPPPAVGNTGGAPTPPAIMGKGSPW